MDLAFDTSWENDTIVTANGLPSILSDAPSNFVDDRPTAPALDAIATADREQAHEQRSYVGALPTEQDDVRARRHQELAQAWAALAEKTNITTWDGSIKAAAETLAARVAEIGEACAFLARVKGHAKEASLADMLSDDAPLTAYLAGTYLWLDEVVEALDVLAAQLADMTPEWSQLRERLDDVQWIFDLAGRERVKVIATDLAWVPEHVESDLRHLFAAIDALRDGLDQKFG